MKTFIIAEAGVNHNGSIEIAKKLIDAGRDAGVDAVKFQTFIPESLSVKNTPMAEYQRRNTGKNDSQIKMLKSLVLSRRDHYELLDYCSLHDVKFCSSAFDFDSIDFLKELKLPFWKIPSGEITNYPYLKKIAEYNEPVILSTGMSTLSNIEAAIEVFEKNGTERKKITLLHCNTDYPTPVEDVNLSVLKTLKQAFCVKVGYSDHTFGIEFPIAAVALGAEVIEKHITIDKTMSGPDHKASLCPEELKTMVSAIRNIEKGLGSSIKRVTESEKDNVLVARKSLVAACNIKKGEIFSKDNVTTKRPGNGLSPMKWAEIIGKKANTNFRKDELIELY